MFIRPLAWCLLPGLGLWAAAPTIDRDGIRNAASLIPGGLPGGGVAPGSRIIIRGRDFVPSGKVVIVIESGGRRWTLPVSSSRPNALEALLPAELLPGLAMVTVLTDGLPGNTVSVRVVPSAFGIFTDEETGMGAAVSEPVQRGQTVTLQGTGLALRPGGQPPRVEVFVGGKTSRVVSVEPVRPGLDQIRFEVPASAPRGCHVPVMVRLGGFQPSNWAALPVEPDPGICSELGRARKAMREGGSAGFVIPLHLSMRYQAEPRDRVDFTGDSLIAGFRSGNDPSLPGRLLGVPERGTCIVYAKSVDIAQLSTKVNSDVLAKTEKLTPGPLELALGTEKRTVAPPPPDRAFYYQTIGGEMPDMAASQPLFLRPGTLHISTHGKAGLPALAFDVRIPETVQWTSRNRTDVVDRGKDLTIHWEAKNASQPVAIAGINIDKPSRAAAAFLCLPERKSSSFRVPVEVLQALPPSRTQFDQSLGFVFVATLPALEAPRFNEGGLDALLATGIAADGRNVQFH